MRQIKFKAKDYAGEWQYGDLEYNRKEDVARIHTYKEDGSYDKQYIVLTDTVDQFTGMLDKNGTEIYEGDIVKYRLSDWRYKNNVEYKNMVVMYDEGRAKFAPDGKYSLDLSSLRCEVVGNIHDGE